MFFFFNDTATTEIYTLSLHDALPISAGARGLPAGRPGRRRDRPRPAHDRAVPLRQVGPQAVLRRDAQAVGLHRRQRTPPSPAGVAPPPGRDRKSTRLNSSHANISYAVFCLKKKKQISQQNRITR